MELTDKQWLKLADAIRQQLQTYHIQQYSDLRSLIYNVSFPQGHLEIIRQALEKCSYKNWWAAAKKLTQKAQKSLRDLPSAISKLEFAMEALDTPLPATREIYADLQQVQDEFGRLEYDQDENTLSVYTDPIELEDIYLGDFQVQLHLSQLSAMKNNNFLKVIALDPHPAACNDAVTHPHVSDEFLCAGDAVVAIQNALANGRVCDMFILVRSVLETYNSLSPYVSLNEWDGISCYECGYIACEEETFYCESCDRVFCLECSSLCHFCETSMCISCLTSCPVCEISICESCLQACQECEETMCESCLEDGLCASCREDKETDDEKETTEIECEIPSSNQQVA